MDLMTDPLGVTRWRRPSGLGTGIVEDDWGICGLRSPSGIFEINKYTELCSALDIPILATETSRGCHWEPPSPSRPGNRPGEGWMSHGNGGITGTLKIAHLAESFGMNCEMHTTTMNYMDIATLHVACAVRNSEWFEYFVPEDNFRLPMQGNLPIQNGIITVPDRPGWELNWIGS